MWTYDTTTHLYNPHHSIFYNKVKLVTAVQQIKTALRLSATKKQRFGDVGNTASFCKCHPNKTNGSDITGRDITRSDITGNDITVSDVTGNYVTENDKTISDIIGSGSYWKGN